MKVASTFLMAPVLMKQAPLGAHLLDKGHAWAVHPGISGLPTQRRAGSSSALTLRPPAFSTGAIEVKVASTFLMTPVLMKQAPLGANLLDKGHAWAVHPGISGLPTQRTGKIQLRAHLAAGLLNEGDRDEGGQHIDDTSDHGGQECAALGVDGLEDDGCIEHDGVDACPLLEARNHCGHNLCSVLQSLSGMFIALQALS